MEPGRRDIDQLNLCRLVDRSVQRNGVEGRHAARLPLAHQIRFASPARYHVGQVFGKLSRYRAKGRADHDGARLVLALAVSRPAKRRGAVVLRQRKLVGHAAKLGAQVVDRLACLCEWSGVRPHEHRAVLVATLLHITGATHVLGGSVGVGLVLADDLARRRFLGPVELVQVGQQRLPNPPLALALGIEVPAGHALDVVHRPQTIPHIKAAPLDAAKAVGALRLQGH